MARIGLILKQARLARGIGLDRVAADTNIGLRYLVGLEADDFSFFPGEPYIVGFMRNYAEYLGLDAQGIIAEYRREEIPAAAPPETASPAPATAPSPESAPTASPIGLDGPIAQDSAEDSGHSVSSARPVSEPESAPKGRRRRHSLDPNDPLDAILAAGPPVQHASPAEQNHGNHSPAPGAMPAPAPESQTRAIGKKRFAAIAGLAFVLVFAAFAAFMAIRGAGSSRGPGKTGNADRLAGGLRQAVEHRVESMPFERRLYPEDSLIIGFAQDLYKFRLTVIDDAVAFETPFGPVKVGLGKEAPFDPDKDGDPDFALIVSEFARGDPASGALIRVEAKSADPAKPSGQDGTGIKIPSAEAQGTAAETPAGPEILLRSSRGPFPFVITVAFRGPCMFRYESDRREWVEKYYSKGESITINATNTLQLWASNARAARASLQAPGGKTVDFELGGAGEIAVKRLSWSQGAGSWTLGVAEAD